MDSIMNAKTNFAVINLKVGWNYNIIIVGYL